jgi:hypothetical protein
MPYVKEQRHPSSESIPILLHIRLLFVMTANEVISRGASRKARFA